MADISCGLRRFFGNGRNPHRRADANLSVLRRGDFADFVSDDVVALSGGRMRDGNRFVRRPRRFRTIRRASSAQPERLLRFARTPESARNLLSPNFPRTLARARFRAAFRRSFPAFAAAFCHLCIVLQPTFVVCALSGGNMAPALPRFCDRFVRGFRRKPIGIIDAAARIRPCHGHRGSIVRPDDNRPRTLVSQTVSARRIARPHAVSHRVLSAVLNLCPDHVGIFSVHCRDYARTSGIQKPRFALYLNRHANILQNLPDISPSPE